MTSLNSLRLDGNNISDLYPLVENEGINNGDFLILYENPLNSESINTYIPALEARGVVVVFY